MKRFYAAGLLLLCAQLASAQTTGDYRSKATGNWGAATTWETFNGTIWVDASQTPDATSGAITIQSPNNVTVAASTNADQLTVASGGTLTIASGQTFTVANDGTAASDLINRGTVTITGSLVVAASATYQHDITSNALPIATWETGSTLYITGLGSSGTNFSNVGQAFYNWIYECPNQGSASVTMLQSAAGPASITINGDLIVRQTGTSGKLRFFSTDGKSATVRGNVVIGTASNSAILEGTSSSSVTGTVNLESNVSIVNGQFRGTGATGAAVVFNMMGDFAITAAGALAQGSGTSTFNFIKTGRQTFTKAAAGTISSSGTLNVNVTSNSILDLGTSIFNASNGGINFAVLNGGTIATADPGGFTSVTGSGNTTGAIRLTNASNVSKTFSSGASYEFNGTTAQITGNFTTTPTANTVRKLITSNTAGVTLTNATTVTDSLNINAGSLTNGVALTLAASTGNANIGAGALLIANAATDFNGRPVTVRSTAAGTGAILGSTAVSNASNVTVERFVPGKANRRFSFIASPISQSVASAWQQQIHITGPGSGGTACAGNTGQPTAHSNGFDATSTNAPSMFTYDASLASGSRWVANTTGTTATTLTPGTGYRLLVRGPRSSGCALLNGATTTAAATLAATGSITTGVNDGTISRSYNNSTAGNWVLVGNPYISALSFTAFQTTNSSAIGTSYILYDPQNEATGVSANIYSTWNGSTWVNASTRLSDANGPFIAQGQAIMVQALAAGNLSLTYQSSHKTAGNHDGAFRNSGADNQYGWSRLLRLGMYQQNTADSSRLDELVLRFSQSNAAVSTTQKGDLDASKLSSGVSSIASLKQAEVLSIQTRPTPTIAGDTVRLKLAASATGQYLLSISEQLDMDGIDVILRDKFLGTQQPIVLNQPLAIDVTANTASQGSDRFELIFRSSATLAAKFISVSGERTADKATVRFTAQEDGNVKTFAVERSQDGSRFEAVASLKGSDRAGQFSYAAEDGSVNSAVVYYRIKANNANGTADYSQVIKLSSKAAISMTMSPNPARDIVTLKAEGLSAKATVRFTDASGRVVLSLPLTITGSGTQQLSVSSLAQGIYQVQVVSESGETLSTQKLIKQ